MTLLSEQSSLMVGLKQVKKAISENKAKKVFLAKDCDDFLKTSIENLCANAGIEPEYVDTMKQLGQECGIDVGAACACSL